MKLKSAKNYLFYMLYFGALKISYVPLNLSHQDASFKYPYDYVWSDIFYQKSGKIGRKIDCCYRGTSILDHIFINKKTLIVVWEHLKLTKSKSPWSKGRTLAYYDWLLNVLYASVCRLYWEQGSKLLVFTT